MFESKWEYSGSRSSFLCALEHNGGPLVLTKGPTHRERYTVYFPGWDSYVLKTLPDCAGLASQWFWDRAEIDFDHEKSSITFRWIYWTPLQIALHGLFLEAFATGSHRAPDLIVCVLSNLLIIGFSLFSFRRVLSIVRHAVFGLDARGIGR